MKSVQLNIKADRILVSEVRREVRRCRIKGRRITPALIVNAMLRDFFASWTDGERRAFYEAELKLRHPSQAEDDALWR